MCGCLSGKLSAVLRKKQEKTIGEQKAVLADSDGTATVTREEQQRLTVDAIVNKLIK